MGENKRPRVRGVPLSDDLANQFGHIIKPASPSVQFTFGNPPLRLPESDKVIFIVHIPVSTDRPHMVDGRFYYRTNEGNQMMSYEQVRDAFLRYDERRYKIKHLYVELLDLRSAASFIRQPQENPFEEYPILTMDASVVKSLLVDTFSMIQDDPILVANLLGVRRLADIINNRILEFRAIKPALMTSMDVERKREIGKLNGDLNINANQILKRLNDSIKTLETKYGLTDPLQNKPIIST